KYLDDFYAFNLNKDSNWKWINGDLMILDWYDKRGRNLSWDSVVVVQWDMLIFDSLLNQFSKIKKDQIYLSGLRKLDAEIENKWDWTRPDKKERQNYLNFLEYVKINYGYVDQPSLCSLFIFQIFPRIFFKKYLRVKNKEVGMLEYKIPIYAKIFNISFFKKNIGVWWFSDEPKPLNARSKEISKDYIQQELAKKNGWRIFHPYYKIWK
ncbi:MAG: hypothetical protein C0412_17445, partial [Flavobacterium sp.]|nr:hypothetical protein [Flavobacterium sp.]